MRSEDRLILELCKESRDDDVVLTLIKQDGIDWAYFFRIIAKHEIAPLVLSRLMEHPLPAAAQELLQPAARKEIVAASATRSTMRAELARVQAALEQEGIECLLLKGLSLDFSGLRTIKDLDILVPEDRYIEAIRAVDRIGYEFVGPYRSLHLTRAESELLLEAVRRPTLELEDRSRVLRALCWNNHYQAFNRDKNLMVEIHTNLFQRRRAYMENIDRLLDSIDCFWGDKRHDPTLNCFTLSNEHALLLMALHMAIYRSPGNNTFIFKLACDMDGLIRRGVCWKSFSSAACRMRVQPFVLFSLLQTRGLLGTSVPQDCLKRLERDCKKAQRWLIRVHLKCLRSLDSYRLVHSNVYRVLKPFVFEGRLGDRLKSIFLVSILFPSKGKMAAFFNVSKDSPLIYLTYLLNPVRLMILIFRSVNGVGNDH